MIVLGLSGALTHDPSAALFVDGHLVSAAEEERFLRDKHAKRCWPLHAARYCLEAAGISAAQVDAVAFPFAANGPGRRPRISVPVPVSGPGSPSPPLLQFPP